MGRNAEEGYFHQNLSFFSGPLGLVSGYLARGGSKSETTFLNQFYEESNYPVSEIDWHPLGWPGGGLQSGGFIVMSP